MLHQGREIRVPVPGTPETFNGEKITGTNDFASVSRKSYGPARP